MSRVREREEISRLESLSLINRNYAWFLLITVSQYKECSKFYC